MTIPEKITFRLGQMAEPLGSGVLCKINGLARMSYTIDER